MQLINSDNFCLINAQVRQCILKSTLFIIINLRKKYTWCGKLTSVHLEEKQNTRASFALYNHRSFPTVTAFLTMGRSERNYVIMERNWNAEWKLCVRHTKRCEAAGEETLTLSTPYLLLLDACLEVIINWQQLSRSCCYICTGVDRT